MVEGSIIGSFLCGILLLPGVAMFSNGLVRKEQEFNSKSAGVSSTMMILYVLLKSRALIGAFTPTLFHSIYASFELKCSGCSQGNCSSCFYAQPHPALDPVFLNGTRYLQWVCAAVLVGVYGVGLVFTLHTHSRVIYGKEHVEQNASPVERIDSSREGLRRRPVSFAGLGISHESDRDLHSPLSYRDQAVPSRDQILHSKNQSDRRDRASHARQQTDLDQQDDASSDSQEKPLNAHGGPNWSTTKSCCVLLASTLLFSAIAEVLVDSVDSLLSSSSLDEKFLGLTLFALVPSVTEFCWFFLI